jgi:hypothetical protein
MDGLSVKPRECRLVSKSFWSSMPLRISTYSVAKSSKACATSSTSSYKARLSGRIALGCNESRPAKLFETHSGNSESVGGCWSLMATPFALRAASSAETRPSSAVFRASRSLADASIWRRSSSACAPSDCAISASSRAASRASVKCSSAPWSLFAPAPTSRCCATNCLASANPGASRLRAIRRVEVSNASSDKMCSARSEKKSFVFHGALITGLAVLCVSPARNLGRKERAAPP